MVDDGRFACFPQNRPLKRFSVSPSSFLPFVNPCALQRSCLYSKCPLTILPIYAKSGLFSPEFLFRLVEMQ